MLKSMLIQMLIQMLILILMVKLMVMVKLIPMVKLMVMVNLILMVKLMVMVTDINDNAPQFAADYRPVVYENRPAGQMIITVSAVDPDTATNGPPFEFWLPCHGMCPCDENPTCADFGFQFVPSMSGVFLFISKQKQHHKFTLAVQSFK